MQSRRHHRLRILGYSAAFLIYWLLAFAAAFHGWV